MTNWHPKTPQMSEPSVYAFYLKLQAGLCDNYYSALGYALQLDHPARSFLTGLVLLQRWQDLEAEKEFRNYLVLNPDSAGTYCNIAILKDHDFDEAKTLFRKGWELAIDPREPALLISELTRCHLNHKLISSQEKRRALLIEQDLREVLVMSIRRLLKNSPFDEDWLLTNGGEPKADRRLVSGPIDAHYHNCWVYGEALVALNLEDERISLQNLSSVLKNWDHLVAFFENPNHVEWHVRSYAAFPQRTCCLEP